MALPRAVERLLGLLLTFRCPGCGRSRGEGELLCDWCRMRIVPAGPPRDSGTGMPSGRSGPRGVIVTSAMMYRGLGRELVVRLKYGGERHLAGVAARLMLERCRPRPGRGDLLVPVPTTGGRLRERGYNQSLLIARRLAALSGAVAADALARDDGPPQVGLPLAMRRRNVEGAFRVVGPVPPADRTWMVDDVATTLSTMDSMARALSREVGGELRGVTLAYRGRGPASILRTGGRGRVGPGEEP